MKIRTVVRGLSMELLVVHIKEPSVNDSSCGMLALPDSGTRYIEESLISSLGAGKCQRVHPQS